MTSLSVEHGELLGTLLLVKAVEIYYVHQTSSPPLPIYIDNTEVVKRGQTPPPQLGTKAQFSLDYDM